MCIDSDMGKWRGTVSMGGFPSTGSTHEEGIVSALEEYAYHAGREKFCIKVPGIYSRLVEYILE